MEQIRKPRNVWVGMRENIFSINYTCINFLYKDKNTHV